MDKENLKNAILGMIIGNAIGKNLNVKILKDLLAQVANGLYWAIINDSNPLSQEVKNQSKKGL